MSRKWVESGNMISDVMTMMTKTNVSLGLVLSVLNSGNYLLSIESQAEIPSQSSSRVCVNTTCSDD